MHDQIDHHLLLTESLHIEIGIGGHPHDLFIHRQDIDLRRKDLLDALPCLFWCITIIHQIHVTSIIHLSRFFQHCTQDVVGAYLQCFLLFLRQLHICIVQSQFDRLEVHDAFRHITIFDRFFHQESCHPDDAVSCGIVPERILDIRIIGKTVRKILEEFDRLRVVRLRYPGQPFCFFSRCEGGLFCFPFLQCLLMIHIGLLPCIPCQFQGSPGI